MRFVHQLPQQRLNPQAGIAIGPILFIIAILAILAAAIAAGSGSFTAPTGAESAKTTASGLIAQGDNLKIGMDRLVMENQLSYGQWNINAASTSNNNDLFAPAGGGISPPGSSLAANPSTDVWYYPIGQIPGLGTSASEQFAVLNVTSSVCDAINTRASGFNTPTGAGMGNFESTSDLTTTVSTGWPAVLNSKTVGCVHNTTAPAGYYFYQVLYIQ